MIRKHMKIIHKLIGHECLEILVYDAAMAVREFRAIYLPCLEILAANQNIEMIDSIMELNAQIRKYQKIREEVEKQAMLLKERVELQQYMWTISQRNNHTSVIALIAIYTRYLKKIGEEEK